MSSSRILIVSNRLPITAVVHDGVVRVQASSGGLATGLGRWHEATQGLWIGWPGELSRLAAQERAAFHAELATRRIVAVPLSGEHLERHYNGFSNRVLWPLCHYLIDRVPLDATGWSAYQAVNQEFADTVAFHYRAGDTIWIHDYQLMLLPALLRARLPEARIGFFLHVPFPSSEVFRILPWRREILRGLLGADLVGFHTFAYLRHYVASLLHVDGVEAEIDRVHVDGREVRLGVFPMGVDHDRFGVTARRPDVQARAAAIRSDAGGRAIILGVDRLDYTKGIPRRLQAIERLLARDSSLSDAVRYVQVAVPSRGQVDQYQRYRSQVEERVGRINGLFGTLKSAPVHYIHQSVEFDELVALYLAADVMLVTPLRDGMNLVAKEFVAARVGDGGVLVLSEFAGAAAELAGAVLVNPYDVEAVADAVQRALAMPVGEQRARMNGLRLRVCGHGVHEWASSFLQQLDEARPRPAETLPEPGPSLSTALTDARHGSSLRVLLDYDGTLVPFARSPGLAAPDESLLVLLRRLAARPNTEVEIVSGRPRETLEAWLGMLPVGLWAEHGFWNRPAGTDAWHSAASLDPKWMARLLPIFEQFAATTPGAFVERKTASIAWHYRRAHREFGVRQAHELRMLLGDALSNQPFEVLEGTKVIEVRLRGVSKGAVGRQLAGRLTADMAVIAFGDDHTDEDLFRSLPQSAVTVSVGTHKSQARFAVADHVAVREALGMLLTESPVALHGH
ncbi:MAG: bifunctional alpha,alpha-trehalose-phosphate synthase (UDP-forming)/trehalose-phosphatase [Acidobacteriota bacterium]